MTPARRRELIESVRSIPVHVRSLPTITDLASGRVKLGDIRELDVNDLLGRDPVEPHGLLLNLSVRGKTVLVTGAAQSSLQDLGHQSGLPLGRPTLEIFFHDHTHEVLLSKA